mgnify:CR=1 FL=1
MLQQVRDADMKALKASVAALEATDFPERQQSLTRLAQAVSKLEALHKESVTAIGQPKAQRRSNLAQEYNKETADLMELIDKISSQLNRAVKLEDSLTDQLLVMKQLAWMARNAAGDASVMISNAMAGLPLPPEPMTVYKTNIAKMETAWGALEDMAAGLPLPLTGFTLRQWMSEANVALAAIGLTALIGIAYSFKFVWSPFMDRLELPWFTRRLGRRRGWLLPVQVLLALAIAGLALTDPAINPLATVAVAVAVAAASLASYLAVRARLLGDVDDSLRQQVERVAREGPRALPPPGGFMREPGFGGPQVYSQVVTGSSVTTDGAGERGHHLRLRRHRHPQPRPEPLRGHRHRPRPPYPRRRPVDPDHHPRGRSRLGHVAAGR